jgi:hypothetical protein
MTYACAKFNKIRTHLEIVPVNDIKDYGKSEVIAPVIFILGTSWTWVINF